MHYTLSEDRCGDQDSVMAQRLAALGARPKSIAFNENGNTFHNPGDRRLRAAKKVIKLYNDDVVEALRASRLPQAERQIDIAQEFSWSGATRSSLQH